MFKRGGWIVGPNLQRGSQWNVRGIANPENEILGGTTRSGTVSLVS